MNGNFYHVEDASHRVVGRLMILDDGRGWVTLMGGYKHDNQERPLLVFKKAQGEEWPKFGDRREIDEPESKP